MINHLHVEGAHELYTARMGGRFSQMPLEARLQQRMETGRRVVVCGVVNDAPGRFSVNLLTGGVETHTVNMGNSLVAFAIIERIQVVAMDSTKE